MIRNFVRIVLVTVSFITAAAAVAAPPGTPAEISERIAPFGEVCVEGGACGDEPATEVVAVAEPAGPRSAEQVYNTFCTACHAIGVAGAPKFADAAAWEPRIAKGMDALYQSTYNGINAMPPRGTCGDCSDEELQLTVDYMVSAAQ